MNNIVRYERGRKSDLLKVWEEHKDGAIYNYQNEEDKFVGEGRFLWEGAETSCCLEVGTTRAATFTQQSLNQTNARIAR